MNVCLLICETWSGASHGRIGEPEKKYRSKYIAHIRSEANQLLEAVDELIGIARAADIPAEIYHLKAAGEQNWPKMDAVIRRINDALRSTAFGSSDSGRKNSNCSLAKRWRTWRSCAARMRRTP